MSPERHFELCSDLRRTMVAYQTELNEFNMAVTIGVTDALPAIRYAVHERLDIWLDAVVSSYAVCRAEAEGSSFK